MFILVESIEFGAREVAKDGELIVNRPGLIALILGIIVEFTGEVIQFLTIPVLPCTFLRSVVLYGKGGFGSHFLRILGFNALID